MCVRFKKVHAVLSCSGVFVKWKRAHYTPKGTTESKGDCHLLGCGGWVRTVERHRSRKLKVRGGQAPQATRGHGLMGERLRRALEAEEEANLWREQVYLVGKRIETQKDEITRCVREAVEEVFPNVGGLSIRVCAQSPWRAVQHPHRRGGGRKGGEGKVRESLTGAQAPPMDS